MTANLTRTVTPWPAQRMAASLFLVLGTDMFVVSPLLPQISDTFDVTSGEAAVVGWSFALVYALLSPVITLITNRFTRRTAMWFGASLFSLGALTVAVMPTLELVVIGRMIAAVGASAMGPPVWSFASETAAPHEVGRAVAAVASTFAAGQIIGVPLASLVSSYTSWRWVFVALGVIAACLAILIGFCLGKESRKPEKAKFSQVILDSLSLWTRSNFRLLVLTNFFAQATRYATYTFAGALLFFRFGLDTAQLGLIGASVGAGSLVGSMVGGRLVDWARARQRSQPFLNVIYAGIMTCGIILATAAGHLWLSLVGWIVTFAAGAALVSNGQELLTSTTGPRRAYALSWNNASLYGGTAAGTFCLGLAELGSTTFVLIAVAYGLLAVIASFLLWRYAEISKVGVTS